MCQFTGNDKGSFLYSYASDELWKRQKNLFFPRLSANYQPSPSDGNAATERLRLVKIPATFLSSRLNLSSWMAAYRRPPWNEGHTCEFLASTPDGRLIDIRQFWTHRQNKPLKSSGNYTYHQDHTKNISCCTCNFRIIHSKQLCCVSCEVRFDPSYALTYIGLSSEG